MSDLVARYTADVALCPPPRGLFRSPAAALKWRRASRRAQWPVALITGANRGIGLAVARKLALADVIPVLGARDGARGAEAAAILVEAGLPATSVALDVASDRSVERGIERVVTNFGRIDILVNNAAVFLERRDARVSAGQGAAAETVLEMLNINAVGAYRVIAAVLPLMLRQGYGRIVNVSSDMARFDQMDVALLARGGYAVGYRMSKVALNAMTRVLAEELAGTNVKINSISPGCVRTRMGRSNADRSPEEAAESIVWLARIPDDGQSGCFFKDRQMIPW